MKDKWRKGGRGCRSRRRKGLAFPCRSCYTGDVGSCPCVLGTGKWAALWVRPDVRDGRNEPPFVLL